MRTKPSRRPEGQSARGHPQERISKPSRGWHGVATNHQVRSEDTYQALIRAGRRALEARHFEKITIANLARDAGTSVGAFYGRFENKQAYFAAIQQTIVEEIEDRVQRMLDKLENENACVAEFLSTIAAMWVFNFSCNKGLYLFAFKDSTALPDLWTPFKRLGWNTSGQIAALLRPRLKAIAIPAKERDIRIAMQFINSVLVNATINDPGPIHLEGGEMAPYLAKLLCVFLGLEPPRPRVVALAVRKVAALTATQPCREIAADSPEDSFQRAYLGTN